MNRDINILEVDKRNSWPLMSGTYKLFKRYYSVNYKIIFNKNKSNPNGQIQANPDFDNNFNIDIGDVLKFIKSFVNISINDLSNVSYSLIHPNLLAFLDYTNIVIRL